MCLAQRGERHHRQPQFSITGAEGFGFAGVLFERGGKTVQALDQEKIAFAIGAPDQRLDHTIARAQPRIKRRERRLRLDHKALPAALVEPERNIVGDRMPGADIDVAPARLAREGEREVIVLEILRVG